MTGKLIKYEIRSSMRLIGVIWAALVAAALLLSFTSGALARIIPDSFTETSAFGLIEFISGFLFVGIFIALIVATVMIVIVRFYRGLLGDEGYLMHTLPVKPWQLITSKGVVSAAVVLVSILVAVVSMLILAGFNAFVDVADFFAELGKMLKEEPKFILAGIEMLIVLVLSVLKSIYQIYASLSIGQLSGKHRILLALGAYIGISVILSILGVIMMSIGEELGIVDWFVGLGDRSVFSLTQAGIVGMFLLTVVQLAVFHVITERILSKKLNLL